MVLDVVRIQDAAVDRGAGLEVERSMQTDDRLIARGEDSQSVLADTLLSIAQGFAWKMYDCRAGGLGMRTDLHDH